ncbi:HAD family hydrolase [Halobacterium litoreum]|uniref:HAD family hydrolase n=1 Tax=Halobacterium litoreum TaxID=2039234 RepID=A0ABD5NCX4_9EURY|nr:HAD family hydrolase [Halobacterium litoreum]UHH14005.1 HAD family hydrolase [Halobacterium litoreum]
MRAIYFDLDGTLLQFDEGDVVDAMTAAFEAVAGEARDEWLEAYNAGFLERFEACEPAPYRGGVERARAEAGFDGGVEETAAALLDAEIELLEPSPGAGETLAELGEAYRVGVLTNGAPEFQRAKLAAHGLHEHVDCVVASYEAGAHKPDLAPFELAERRLPADAYALVGDADADVDGAANAGWDALRYGGGELGDVPGDLGWA